MIWIRLSGGLGNQLFQWSAGEEVRLKALQDIEFYTRDLKNYWVPRDFLLNDLIGDFYSIGSPSAVTRFILKYRITKMCPRLFAWNINQKNIATIRRRDWYVLDDYFQNTLLLKAGIAVVVGKIRKSAFRDGKIKALFEKLLDGKLQEEVAAVHIRRTDYLAQANRQIFHRLGIDYYFRAFKKLDKRVKKLYVFSDGDREDLPALPHQEITHMKSMGLNDLEEFLLLSLFSSIIIANSTFSFWAAMISEGNRGKRIKIGPVHWLLNEEGNKTWNNNLLNAGFIII